MPWSPAADTLSVTSAGTASDSQLVSVSSDPPAADQFIPGRLHVKLVDGASIEQVFDANEVQTLGAHELAAPGDYYTRGWYRVDVDEGAEIAVASSIIADPDVLYAGPVPRPIPQEEPNDPLYSSQWALAKIGMPSAWNVSKGSGTKIAIIDTGFDSSHPDLSGRLLPGWNCDGGTSVSPLSNHGTRVAGVAAAKTDTTPAYGIAGVAWDAQIIPLRYDVLVEGSCQEDGAVFLIEKAIQLGADVINMSYGGLIAGPGVCAKLRDASAAGIVAVAAAGNDNWNFPEFPAACNGVIAVGATEPNDNKTDYSNYGSWVDISAPGGTGTPPPVFCTGDANTLIYASTTPRPPDHVLGCGTSFAAPQVAGVAALLAARGFFPCEIEETLKDTAVSTPWEDGAGRIDAGAALNHWAGGPIVSETYWPSGALIYEGSGPVYVILGERKYGIHNPQDFNNMGFDWNNIQCIPGWLWEAIPEGPADNQIVYEWGTSPSSSSYAVQCSARFLIPNGLVLVQLELSGYQLFQIPPGEIARLESLGYLAAVPPAYCNLRETDTSTEYIMCPDGGSSATKWAISQIHAPDYIRERLLPNEPYRTLWEGALSAFSQPILLYCEDLELPVFPGDEPGDGWDDRLEDRYLGTHQYVACSQTPDLNDEVVDKWPTDLNDDQRTDFGDVLMYGGPSWGESAGDPNWDPRFDLNADGSVDFGDVIAFGDPNWWLKYCIEDSVPSP